MFGGPAWWKALLKLPCPRRLAGLAGYRHLLPTGMARRHAGPGPAQERAALSVMALDIMGFCATTLGSPAALSMR